MAEIWGMGCQCGSKKRRRGSIAVRFLGMPESDRIRRRGEVFSNLWNLPKDSRDAGNGEGCREMYEISVRGSRAVVSYKGLTRGCSIEERGRAVVGLQKLLASNRKRGKGRGYLEMSRAAPQG